MYDGGLHGIQIARELRLPPTTVYTVLSNHSKCDTIELLKSPRRPPKLSEYDKRSLKHLLIQDYHYLLADISNLIATNVSSSTIYTIAHELSFQSQITAIKLFLNAKYIAKRLEFVKVHKNQTIEDWQCIIWTDESTFEVRKNSHQIHIQYIVDKKYNSDCLAPTFKSSYTSVMVQGAFISNRQLSLVFIPSRQYTIADFIEIVYEVALSSFLEVQEDTTTLTLIEDGALVHQSNIPKA